LVIVKEIWKSRIFDPYCPTTEKIFYKLSFDNEYLEMPHKVLRVQNDQNIE